VRPSPLVWANFSLAYVDHGKRLAIMQFNLEQKRAGTGKNLRLSCSSVRSGVLVKYWEAHPSRELPLLFLLSEQEISAKIGSANESGKKRMWIHFGVYQGGCLIYSRSKRPA
jgi:hypothetical protein